MIRYIIKRVLLLIPVIIAVSLIMFALLDLKPENVYPFAVDMGGVVN